MIIFFSICSPLINSFIVIPNSLHNGIIKDKSGRPYLESHHVITLADNGPDAIYNTVAICPNCHRKMHVIDLKEDVEKLKCKK